MFTGIVEEVGRVVEVSETGLGVRASVVMEDIGVSDSISVNGACLTVTQIEGDAFWVDTVPETMRRTNLGGLSVDSPVNLERPLRADGRFGGHVVQGHVDGTGTVLSITPGGQFPPLRVPGSGRRDALHRGEGIHSCGRGESNSCKLYESHIRRGHHSLHPRAHSVCGIESRQRRESGGGYHGEVRSEGE